MNRLNSQMALALAFPLTCCLSGTVTAQTPARACCLPDHSCIVTTAYECSQAGGITRSLDGDCNGHPCTTITLGSIGMSQTAARRLVREGVVHTLQISDPEPRWQDR
ncbi:MAG: hypothetical protein KF869_08060 [Phycisphaeraceae bacterium]|nr:hypothetical protein [Phycisphaeraceae bacterium]